MEDLVSLAQPPLLQGMWIRIKAVIAQEKVYADRGHSTVLEPSYMPIYPESLKQAREQPKSALLGTEKCWDYWQIIKNRGLEKKNAITL
ncbi:hypothetical protein NYO67_8080 [Aspergillus flavus]|nr:hypothetical protein NYO67_8080 [Aspergillus flavus]